MSQGTITLVPVGGLAKRMKAIDAAYHLAKDCGSKLQVIWFKDKGLNCRFDQLFQHPTDSIITIRKATFCDLLLEDRPRKKNFFLPWLPEHLKYDACIYEQQATILFYDHFDYAAWARNRRVYLASCVYFHPQPVEKLFKLFQPISSLQQEIAKRCADFNGRNCRASARHHFLLSYRLGRGEANLETSLRQSHHHIATRGRTTLTKWHARGID